MPKRKCTGCADKSRYDPATMINLPVGWFHSYECAIDHGRAKAGKRAAAKKKRELLAVDREFNRATKNMTEKIRRRTGKGGYYEALRTALHRWVKHGLRKGEPCYTCGKQQRHGDAGGAFHVGHYMPAKSVDPRRFMIENLRIQCYSCNTMNSGRQSIFRQNLIEERGLDWVEWLECEVNHASLRDQYPEVADIESEAATYRQLFRDIKS